MPKKRSVEKFTDLEDRKSDFLRSSQVFSKFNRNARQTQMVFKDSPFKGQHDRTKSLLDNRKLSMSQMMAVPGSKNDEIRASFNRDKANIL